MPIYFYSTDIGKIYIAGNNSITNLYLPGDNIPEDMEIGETPVLKEAALQLKSYLDGKLNEFSLPLEPTGTDFMKQIWINLCRIPYGKTATYKEIAVMAGSPKSARAVGLANNRNPIPIFIPCHRVIGSSGSLTGYRGGLELKKKLLYIEKLNKHANF